MKILLVDDHALFRAGLASLLRAWDLQVVGEAGDGQEAIAKVRELRPDLVFMDIKMPRINGLEATRAIKAEFPNIKVVILTVSDDEQDLFEAIKSGAEGYLLKNLREEELAELVGQLRRGEPTMSPGLARKLLREFARLKTAERSPGMEADLTDRETEVLEQVARGATNKEIAATLYISENTVNYHMKNILSKLHLRNRAEVVAWAFQHGFTPRPTE
ncbi:MAG: response regulator transcription factor [Candidatus Tectomicrobia bacterium]|nr:response regulator transcription factor [Candidatus Tectomicrobia bacterium]